MITERIDLFLLLVAMPFILFSIIDIINHKFKKGALILVLATIIFDSGVTMLPEGNNTMASKSEKVISSEKDITNDIYADDPVITASMALIGELKVHYINLGQGESTLIQQGNRNMLIDAGPSDSSTWLMDYLQCNNINRLDYLVLTNANEESMGGAAAIINCIDIDKVFVSPPKTITKSYGEVIGAMNIKSLEATQISLSSAFNLGYANCSLFQTSNIKNDNKNTSSIAIKLTFGDNKFLFTGDGDVSNEQTMIKNGYDLSADVLKIANYGSYSSTSQGFLDKVNPAYAVMSLGKNNKAGYPHMETMKRLKDKSIKVYRTDENGSIVCTSNGSSITFNCNEGGYTFNGEGGSKASSDPKDKLYVNDKGIGTIKGGLDNIYYIPSSKDYKSILKIKQYFKTIREAETGGYKASKK